MSLMLMTWAKQARFTLHKLFWAFKLKNKYIPARKQGFYISTCTKCILYFIQFSLHTYMIGSFYIANTMYINTRFHLECKHFSHSPPPHWSKTTTTLYYTAFISVYIYRICSSVQSIIYTTVMWFLVWGE